MTTIIIGLVIFTIIVVVHELGHYWAARKAGIHVEEFSIGMGPRLLSFVRKETRWSIKLFPIGGSCMMLGEDEGVEDPRSFNSKPVGWRIIVIVGGSAMNFVLAFIIATSMSMFTSYRVPTVANFTEISPVAEAGLQIGDRIVRVNNRNVNIWGDFSLEMQRSDGSPITLVVERDGQRLDPIIVTPQFIEDEENGNRFIVGFMPGIGVGPFFADTWTAADGTINYVAETPWMQRDGFFAGLANGFHNTVFSVRATIFGLTQLVTGGLNANDVMGVVGIVTVVGGQVEESLSDGGGMAAFWSLMSFTYLLSANLGIINLLPLPALDGGRLMFLLLEAVRRKPINPNREGMVHFAGFVLLMALAAFIAYNDVVRMISQ
ncbi:MAG: RIP metalloprotease [Defluviitaleaceae bacterium]|nr:RIP metalloprotease [Defluviitaleaceae bacterium]